jgi:hypothetical protein
MILECFIENLGNYLVNRNWVYNICEKCGSIFFSKSKTSHCQECFRKEYENIHKKKRISILELRDKTINYFVKNGFQHKILNGVLNLYRDTVFIIAALQYYNPILFGNHPIPNEAIIVDQPSVRLIYKDKVSDYDGVSTSFVNIASLQLNIDFSFYLKHLEYWIEFLSSVGIFAGDIHIICSPDPAGTEWYHGWGIDICYRGIEIGRCCYYYNIICNNGKQTNGIDFGFAYERIVWALNMNDYYYNLVSPERQYIGYDCKQVDLLRTIVLILLSGIRISNKDSGYQFRKLCKSFIQTNQENDFYFDFIWYYDFWKKFMDSPHSVEYLYKELQNEFQYLRALSECKKHLVQISKVINSPNDIYKKLLEHRTKNEQR